MCLLKELLIFFLPIKDKSQMQQADGQYQNLPYPGFCVVVGE